MKKMPENMERIAEIAKDAREMGMSYGKYIALMGSGEWQDDKIRHSVSKQLRKTVRDE